jgi:ABC-2 type transport system ATP-binding protein
MKDSILKRARDGAAIILSSHLLHLVQEICSHILILQKGRKVVHGTIAEIRQQFAVHADMTLEDVFFRATSEAGKNVSE